MSDSSSAKSPAETEIPYPDALRLAMQLHRRGDLKAAERLYRILREAMPADPNPTHYLGVLLHQRGNDTEALRLIRESIVLDPTVASWHNNLGNVLLDRGAPDEAAVAYTRCAELDPENVEVLINLGVMYRSLNREAEAEAILKRAVEKNPRFADAHTNLAAVYYAQHRLKEGHEHSAAALGLHPGHPGARKLLGVLYATLGRLDDAAEVFREWLKHEPESAQARHHLAACTGEGVPERAPDGYVQQMFDTFASSFDAKLAGLGYRAPQLVGEAAARLLGAPATRFRIVDAGCGTGLCGPFLSPYAERLVGVDLSGNMLQCARARGHYTDLAKAELVAYLERCDDGQDLIVSADTLCYFGRLDMVFRAARRALRPGGYLVFTVEVHAGETDYRLNPHGRYSHREDYVRRALDEAGFETLTIQSEPLRHENGEPVGGLLVTARARRDMI